MNIWDVIILVLVALALIAAFRAAVGNRKNCCGSCRGCAGKHGAKKEERHGACCCRKGTHL